MGKIDLIKLQEAERNRCLDDVLKSKSPKKIIVAGPGTGKTFTFKNVLKLHEGSENIAMTFIRKLAEDMQLSFGKLAEVKTFHAYCKKILHEQNGKVDLVPYLSEVIKKDSELLGKNYSHFEEKFQTLKDSAVELQFYLARGDYYEVVSFNDSVYRLYIELKKDGNILPQFDQILIDEFQDFNALEVAFIDELQKRGPILIVGDDDQAIYDDRFASPDFLRQKYVSGEYSTFQLPFCSRCPDVVVEATNAIIETAVKRGRFKNRIPKPFKCYLADKVKENKKYPKINVVQCTNAVAVAKYVGKVISQIEEDEIAESWEEGKEYSTVLVVGPKQYLLKVEKDLRKDHPQMRYAKPGETGYTVSNGYELLLEVQDSNLGWRILAEYFLEPDELKVLVSKSVAGVQMKNLLGHKFVSKHQEVVELIRNGLNDGQSTDEVFESLKKKIGPVAEQVIREFFPAKEVATEIDKTKPSILLTSFKGCKGLSAGHVLVVGANNGSIPYDPNSIKDIEVSQFIVALTRTRKQCHIVSNKWLYSPKDRDGKWHPSYKKSALVDFIPTKLIDDLGTLNVKQIEAP